ncbi:MAG TPA: MBL fold metallo-hydrolase [Bryobacteraceae bacterium]|nr:MBL fold metallo-hydrolase [Bryobacteraceae bacterium]
MTRHWISVFGLFVFARLPMLAQQPQPDWEKVQIKLEKLDDRVYLVQGFGGNIGAYVGDDGIVLIDAEQVQLGPKIEAALKTVSQAPVKYVLNTHWHGDHTGGNAYFGKSAVIIAQDEVRKTMQTEPDRLGRITNLPVSVPVLTFSDQFTLHMQGGDIHAVSFPKGHTSSDTIVFMPGGKVVDTGDVFTNFLPANFPAVDFENDGSGGVQGVRAACEYLLSHTAGDVKIIPGHGNLATQADLRKYLDVLNGTVSAIQAGIDHGKSLEQLQRDKVLDKWSYIGEGPKANNYIERIYKSLTAKSSREQ